MFSAVWRIQRPDPLPQFVVLQRRNPFKIPPRHGRQMYRSGIISDFLERRRKVKDCIIFQRNRSVSRGSARHHIHVIRNFFAGLHGCILHFPIFRDHHATFVDRKTRRELVPILRNQALDARIAKCLFIRATRALRPGASGKISELIPSFCKMPAMYFAAASSFPGGFVVLILISSASQPSASCPSAVALDALFMVATGAGDTGKPGPFCAITVPAVPKLIPAARIPTQIFCFPITRLPPWPFNSFFRMTTVLPGKCFILTCWGGAFGFAKAATLPKP